MDVFSEIGRNCRGNRSLFVCDKKISRAPELLTSHVIISSVRETIRGTVRTRRETTAGELLGVWGVHSTVEVFITFSLQKSG